MKIPVVVGLAVIAGALLIARPGSPPLIAQQDETEEAPVVALAEGEKFEHGDWTLVVQGSFSVPSPTRFGYSEVRADVALQNTLSDEPGSAKASELAYRSTALSGDPGYPALVLRDSSGTTHRLNLARVTSTASGGSNLVAQPTAVPGRWTLGYQVPTAYASDLELVAVWEGSPVASWSLAGTETASYPGWPAPPAAVPARWGQDVPWGDDLVVTPLGHHLEVCGQSEARPTPVVYGLAVQVRNGGVADANWTAVHYPDDAAIAIWPDGGSARNGAARVGETYLTDTAQAGTDPLEGIGPELRVVPPQVTTLRMLGFSLSRDGRFSSPFALPEAVALYPPDGAVVWLDTSGSELIDFTVPAEACDDVVAATSFDVVPPA